MLLSPGHSPRHVSSPSPQPASSSLDITPVGSANVISTADPPRKRRRSAVLDEDTYVEAIEKIIERDFFPDIPKLRDRLDWLEAIRSGDPVVIRDTQLKILERRAKAAALKTPSANPDATATTGHGQSQTPGSTFFAFPSATPLGSDKTPSLRPQDAAATSGDEGGPSEDGPLVDTSLSLDEFFRKYTSEDNDSFSKIIEKVNRRKREKYAHLLERDGEDPSKALEVDKRERITDGYGTSDQPLATLEGWKYTAKNLLMYHPTDRGEVPLTEEERLERLKGLTKEINRSNTRFHGKSADSTTETSSKEEANTPILYNTVPAATPIGASWPFPDREAEKSKKYDLEDLRKTPNPFYVESAKKAENGYNFVRTPSPAPDGSPFMTWGEIEGTPLRLDLEDIPVDVGGSADGPRFTIPCPPTRDVRAHSLSREAAKRLREKSKMFQKPPLPLPSPSRSRSASPSRMRNLSPAAQKFVRNAIAKSSHSVDETLRASYRGATPPVSTPRSTPKTSTRFGREASLLKSKSPSPSHGSSPW